MKGYLLSPTSIKCKLTPKQDEEAPDVCWEVGAGGIGYIHVLYEMPVYMHVCGIYIHMLYIMHVCLMCVVYMHTVCDACICIYIYMPFGRQKKL